MKIKNLVIAFVFGLFLVGCGNIQKSPEETAIEATKRLYNGDTKGIMELLDLEGAEKEPGAKEMVEGKMASGAARAKAEADSKGGIKEIIIAEKEIQEDRAMIRTETIFKDDSRRGDNMPLLKKNGKWWVRLK